MWYLITLIMMSFYVALYGQWIVDGFYQRTCNYAYLYYSRYAFLLAAYLFHIYNTLKNSQPHFRLRLAESVMYILYIIYAYGVVIVLYTPCQDSSLFRIDLLLIIDTIVSLLVAVVITGIILASIFCSIVVMIANSYRRPNQLTYRQIV